MPQSPPAQRPLRGILLFMLALMLFALLDATSKHLSASFAVPLLVWARYTLHFAIMLVFVAPSMRLQLVSTDNLALQVVRALALVGTTGFAMMAFRSMPLAEATAVLFLAPLLVTLLAGPFLHERIGAGRWAAVLVGFAGVLLIARPGGALNLAGVLWALAGAACYAAYQLLTRRLSHAEHPLTLLFYTALVGTAVMSLALPWFWFEFAPAPRQWLMIASLGVYGGVGHFILIRAFRLAPASTLTPFGYTQLIWAGLLGWMVFGHIPDAMSTAGMAVIAASGLWLALGKRPPRAQADAAG
ncbi:MAG: DMT family transporter [Zoogloeaceae bacterium]|nr:DMT family transporter [Zoogloeaceae bacterium]MCK6383823.1 DMT family transporter [Rhodocyclaceae bacterium]